MLLRTCLKKTPPVKCNLNFSTRAFPFVFRIHETEGRRSSSRWALSQPPHPPAPLPAKRIKIFWLLVCIGKLSWGHDHCIVKNARNKQNVNKNHLYLPSFFYNFSRIFHFSKNLLRRWQVFSFLSIIKISWALRIL